MTIIYTFGSKAKENIPFWAFWMNDIFISETSVMVVCLEEYLFGFKHFKREVHLCCKRKRAR